MHRDMSLQLVDKGSPPLSALPGIGPVDAVNKFRHRHRTDRDFHFADAPLDLLQKLFDGLSFTLRLDDDAGIED
jgi:hypothetical protein